MARRRSSSTCCSAWCGGAKARNGSFSIGKPPVFPTQPDAGSPHSQKGQLRMSERQTQSRREFIAKLGAGTTLAATARIASAADPITLKFATNDTTQDVSYAIAQRFGTEVARRTNDKYRVQV